MTAVLDLSQEMKFFQMVGQGFLENAPPEEDFAESIKENLPKNSFLHHLH
jgi:hypothetical protein